jgi:hypothetical protein
MNGRSELLPAIMRDARTEGETVEPRALLDTLAAIQNPVMGLSDHDQANAIFASFYNEFWFLSAPGALRPLQPEEAARWTAVLRWLIRTVKGLRTASDPDNRTLVALLVIAEANDWDDMFWEHVPQDVANNSDIVERLKAL